MKTLPASLLSALFFLAGCAPPREAPSAPRADSIGSRAYYEIQSVGGSLPRPSGVLPERKAQPLLQEPWSPSNP